MHPQGARIITLPAIIINSQFAEIHEAKEKNAVPSPHPPPPKKTTKMILKKKKASPKKGQNEDESERKVGIYPPFHRVGFFAESLTLLGFSRFLVSGSPQSEVTCCKF